MDGSADAVVFSDLNGASCLSPSACLAIAFKNGEGGAAAATERSNGRAWPQIAPVPDRVADGRPGPGDVISCASLRACFAEVPTDDGFWTVLHWDGSVWSEPPPSGPWYQEITVGSGTPLGVSCASPAVCTVIGNDIAGAFAARFSSAGSQLDRAAPTPDVAATIGLDSISCVGAMCMTVGEYETAAAVGEYETAAAVGEYETAAAANSTNPVTQLLAEQYG